MAKVSFSEGLKSVRSEARRMEVDRDAVVVKPQGPRTPPSRIGRVCISGYYDPAVRKQFGIIAIEQGRTQEALLAVALNLLFERYGRPPIAKES